MAKPLTPDELDAIECEFRHDPPEYAIPRLIATIRKQWDQIGGLQNERDKERLSRLALERRVQELEGRGDDE